MFLLVRVLGVAEGRPVTGVAPAAGPSARPRACAHAGREGASTGFDGAAGGGGGSTGGGGGSTGAWWLRPGASRATAPSARGRSRTRSRVRVCCFRRRVGGRLAGRLRLDDGGPRRGHRAGRRRGRFGLFARRWVERGGGNGQVGRARGRSRGTLGRNERPRGAGKRREARGGRAGRVTVRNFARRDALGRASRASDPSAHVPSRRALRLLRQRSPSSPRPVLRRRTSRPLSRVVARRPVGCVGCAFSSDATRARIARKTLPSGA